MAGYGATPYGGGAYGSGAAAAVSGAGVTAFNAEPGTRSGRIIPTEIPAAAGDYVLCLGSSSPNFFQTLQPGDYARAAQTADWGGEGTLLRASLAFRAPRVMPAAMRWRLSMQLAGVEVSAHELGEGGAILERVDMGANLVDVSGDLELAFELQLVGVAAAQLVELPAVYVDAITFEGTP